MMNSYSSAPRRISPRSFRLHHVADWVLCACLAAAYLMANKLISPHCRTFMWSDATISYPMHDDTFPVYSLGIVAVGTGVVFILFYLFLFRFLRGMVPVYGNICPYRVFWGRGDIVPLHGEEVAVSSPNSSRVGSPALTAAPQLNPAAYPETTTLPATSRFRSYQCTTGPLYSWLTALIFACVLELFTTCMIKLYAGRLRPDYLSRLKLFGYTADTRVDSNGKIVSSGGSLVPDPHQDPEFYCALGHSVSHVLTEGRLSFPSGHSSNSFAVCIIFSLFLFSHLRPFAYKGSLLRFCVALSPMALALTVATSRTRDNKHNFSDVLTGALIGTGAAFSSFFLCFRIAGGPGGVTLERAEDDVELLAELRAVQHHAHSKFAGQPQESEERETYGALGTGSNPVSHPSTTVVDVGGGDEEAGGVAWCISATERDINESTQAVPWL